MPLKPSTGNMYPWVTHTHCHLGGECPHQCVYCYVDNPRWGRPPKYRGLIRLIKQELDVRYGSDKTIFVENCNDLLSEAVPYDLVLPILTHCRLWPLNTYVFQTKNPIRYSSYSSFLPKNHILGCTIETNRDIPNISKAPRPFERFEAMKKLRHLHHRTFITIEPVLDFDVYILASWIDQIRPEFLNLGADSKDHNLPEPTVEKIHDLVEKLKEYGIELREKHNLKRLKVK